MKNQPIKRALKADRKKSSFKQIKDDKTYITYDPNTNYFMVNPNMTKHQRQIFVNNKLNPSLNILKHVKEEECNTNLCH